MDGYNHNPNQNGLRPQQSKSKNKDHGLVVIAFLILMAPFSKIFVRVHQALRSPTQKN